MLLEDATEEDVERLNAIYGFDLPLHIQYFRWLSMPCEAIWEVSIRQEYL